MVKTAGLNAQLKTSNIDALESKISYTQTEDAW